MTMFSPSGTIFQILYICSPPRVEDIQGHPWQQFGCKTVSNYPVAECITGPKTRP